MFRILNFIFLLIIIFPVFALSNDNLEKLFITADTSIYNYKTGMNIFSGHVKVDQGTTHITADKLTTKNDPQHKIQEAVAYGNQTLAHYWTTPTADEKPLHAKAKIIKFYPITSNIVLQDNVVVTQGDNSFQGKLVLYNMKDQTVTVPETKDGRAVLIYNPNS